MFFKRYIYITIYVNNFLIIELNKKKIIKLKKTLFNKFKMFNLSFYNYYLNINITCNYINKIIYFN